MNVPLRIFYDIQSGQVLQITGNFIDDWLEEYESIEDQIPKYVSLSERNRDSFDVVEFEYGTHTEDFARCISYRVNIETKLLEFSYPDPNNPEAPPVYQKPLTEQITDIRNELKSTQDTLDFLLLG